ncbi:hypothetical protein EXIGLDRAFT_753518 [Exidia glandulosa HHB12029]|uniref:Lipid droplet-associated perilipin protein n=1 Tax=Exidia glandulosa HHB12029 TaxID=1314781 RepID=A0A165DP61_EXIGL|nr:hypothetical protein EXIGLDRAFT_753518 [Exidia glandulosa HHB12029]
MSTETQTAPAATEPQLRSVARVQSIPLVNDTLTSLNSILLQNALTAWPYATAQSISSQTYNIAVPRLQPVLGPIDGLANKGLDFVEQRYPYPFQTPTEDIYNDIQKSRASVYEAADGRIKALAAGADQSIAPIVDVLQAAYNRLNAQSGSETSGNGNGVTDGKDETQVHRALRLSVGVRDQVVVLSSEQLKHLQQQSVVVQRLTDTMSNLNQLVASSVVTAREQASAVTKDGYARANALADSTRAELDRLNATIRAMPANVQQSLQPLQQQITETREALGSVLSSDAPAGEKASKALATLRERVPPVSEQVVKLARDGIAGAIAYVQHAGQAAKEEAHDVKENGVSNGNGNTQ